MAGIPATIEHPAQARQDQKFLPETGEGCVRGLKATVSIEQMCTDDARTRFRVGQAYQRLNGTRRGDGIAVA